MYPRVIVCLSVLVLRCALAAADDQCARLRLRDGRELVGRVIEDTLNSITFEVWIGEFRSEVRYPRSQVADLRLIPCDELEAKVPESAPTADADSPATAPGAEAVVRYVLIPITGGIGFFPDEPQDECVTSEGLHNALQRAKKAGVGHVVLFIDSPGGSAEEADEIVRVLREFQADLTISAVVRKSISAAMWATFAASHIFVLPDASSGAALAFSMDPDTGSAMVDQKQLAARAAQLASWAESHGHSGALARAMVDPSAELWATDGASGFSLSGQRKNEASILLDGAATVVALTADEMVQYGVAKRVNSVAEIALHFDTPRWEQWGKYGEREMFNVSNALAEGERRAIADYESLEQQLTRANVGALTMARSAASAARAAEPGSPYSYEHVSNSTGPYDFTAAGRMRWRNDHQRAIKAWGEVTNIVAHAADLLKEADRAATSLPHSDEAAIVERHRIRMRQIALLAEQLRELRPHLEREHHNAIEQIRDLRQDMDRTSR